ncbi:succinate dehydrogenase/fumarate reductase, flavoprotein subunit [Serpentinimonas raichei]|uniref:Succinate dehydrogenase/fumarate reductase, flavoprotein subunit n=1 Tax=Serpentinimonas raichei TaxID=1458425 RepID=A0A060NQK1_9BURK|nr:succinate dehydrogenase/fumarate reductase, flavoprotein subunit [Serpentinimonas raichei]
MVRKVLWPWNAAALPEIMAEALQESKLGVPEQRPDGQAAGLQPSSAAGARGGGTAEARARPNASVQRRAAQRAVCCNRLLGGMRESSQLHPPQKLGVDRDDHCARRHQNRTHGWG